MQKPWRFFAFRRCPLLDNQVTRFVPLGLGAGKFSPSMPTTQTTIEQLATVWVVIFEVEMCWNPTYFFRFLRWLASFNFELNSTCCFFFRATWPSCGCQTLAREIAEGSDEAPGRGRGHFFFQRGWMTWHPFHPQSFHESCPASSENVDVEQI